MAFCGKNKTQYLALCAVPPVLGRDGIAGANARIYLPFHGHYYYSGAQVAFAGAVVPQDKSRRIGGRNLPGECAK